MTSGIESLDEREKNIFVQRLKAGNLYINRSTTGAIVTRQPFGGMGKSAIGSGKKAGGFNYVTQFLDIKFDGDTSDENANHPYIEKIQEILKDELQYADILKESIKTLKNFAYYLDKEFLQEHDYSHIRGESNIIQYLNLKNITLVIDENNSMYEILCSIGAAKMSGSILHVSILNKFNSPELLWLLDKKNLLLDEGDRILDRKSVV